MLVIKLISKTFNYKNYKNVYNDNGSDVNYKNGDELNNRDI